MSLQNSINGKSEVIIFPSAVRNGNVNSVDFNSGVFSSIILMMNVTAFTALQNFTYNLQNKDFISGNYVTTLTFAVTGNIGIMQLENSVATAINLSLKDIYLAKIFRVQIIPSIAGNYTLSVGATLFNKS